MVEVVVEKEALRGWWALIGGGVSLPFVLALPPLGRRHVRRAHLRTLGAW